MAWRILFCTRFVILLYSTTRCIIIRCTGIGRRRVVSGILTSLGRDKYLSARGHNIILYCIYPCAARALSATVDWSTSGVGMRPLGV